MTLIDKNWIMPPTGLVIVDGIGGCPSSGESALDLYVDVDADSCAWLRIVPDMKLSDLREQIDLILGAADGDASPRLLSFRSSEAKQWEKVG